jgi:opacity protein-like surface antigen
MKRITMTVLLLAATAGPALAQAPHPVTLRGFGGVSFMSETGGTFGAGLGVRLGAHLEAIGEVGRLTNMLPRQIQRDIDRATLQMRPTFGPQLSIDLSAPAVYTFAGLRTTWSAGSRLALFVDGGGGVAHGTSDIDAHVGSNDVSSSVRAALRIKHSETRGLVTVGGGVLVPLTDRLGLDLGYRYMRIFTDDPRVDTGTMSAAVRWGF